MTKARGQFLQLNNEGFVESSTEVEYHWLLLTRFITFVRLSVRLELSWGCLYIFWGMRHALLMAPMLEGNITSLVDDHLAPLAENRNFWMEDKRQPIINKPNIVL